MSSPISGDRQVSIVVPTFNRAAFLRGAIEDCLAQTHRDLELIVVDDGSTDATAEVSRGFDDPRLTVLRHERNRGLPEALNTGFRQAHGAYLTWTGDDDRFAPDAIEEMLAFLESHPQVAFVYADYWVIDAAGTVLDEVHVEPPSALAQGNCVGYCRLHRRDVYEAIGEYDPGAALAEDYDYWLRAARRFRLAALRKTLYYRREHADSLTGRHRLAAARVAECAKRRHGWTTQAEHRRALAAIDIAEAFELHRRGERAETMRRALRAVARHPGYLANRGVLSILLQAITGRRS